MAEDISVKLVDAAKVRGRFKTEFLNAGHHYVYPWIPKNEIWLDADLPEEERKFALVHELTEMQLMRDGLDYRQAHERAAAREREERSKNGVHYANGKSEEKVPSGHIVSPEPPKPLSHQSEELIQTYAAKVWEGTAEHSKAMVDVLAALAKAVEKLADAQTKAPVINVAAPEVTVKPPDVKVEVKAPNVTVKPPVVNVKNVIEKVSGEIKFARDSEGRVKSGMIVPKK